MRLLSHRHDHDDEALLARNPHPTDMRQGALRYNLPLGAHVEIIRA